MNGSSRGAVVAGAVLAALAVLVVALSLSTTPPLPFDPTSTSPSGYAAIARLAEEQGIVWEQRTAVSVAQQGYGPGDVILVPTPGLASFAELDALRAAASAGAVVVFASPPPDPEVPIADPGVLGGLDAAEQVPDDAVLARQPAQPVPPGECDVAELDTLGEVDAYFSVPVDVDGRASCFGDGVEAHVVVAPVGDGRIVTLSGPELLANARLWPDKENGGRPLDNASLLLALVALADGPDATPVRLTFVRAEPSPDAAQAAGRPSNPLRLLPSGVQAGLVAVVVAFCCYAWARSRRLGRVVSERTPVRIAGSELVEAVGELSRRRRSTTREAAALRAEFARRVGVAAGLGPAPGWEQLVEWTARHSGRPPGEVAAILADEVTSQESLVRLSGALDALEEEVSRVRRPV